MSYLDDSYMDEEDIKKKMRQCSSELIYLKKRWEEKFSLPFYFSLFKNLFSRYPYVISKYYTDSMKDTVSIALKQNCYDAIICDFLFSSIFLPEECWDKSILFQHNIESTIWMRHYKTKSTMVKKGYLYFQWLKLFKYEKRVCPKFKACIAVSHEDQEILKHFGVRHTRFIHTGVDTTFFSPVEIEERPYNMVFTGSMDWLPNEDAIVNFVKFTYPKIKKIIPQATLTIVGRHPTKRVRVLEQKDTSIEVTGTVDDVRPYIARALVFIVPIRIGSGTRLKIFEAMSMHKAVVSTSVGTEGLPVHNGENIIIADSDNCFAERTIELLKNSEKRYEIGAAARKLMVKEFDWAVVAREFEQICQEFAISRKIK